jgi:hypothetical protein
MASGEWRVTSGANSIFSNRRVAEKTEEVNIKLCASLRLCGSIVSTAETPRKIKRKNFAPLCAFAVQLFQPQRRQEKSREKTLRLSAPLRLKKSRISIRMRARRPPL